MSRILRFLSPLLVAFLPAFSPPASITRAAGPPARIAPAVSASSAFVADVETGEVLYEQVADEQRAIASTTKIMTAVVTLDHVPPDQLDRVFAVGAMGPRWGETVMGLRTGSRVSVRELLYGMLLPSGNDAAAALARRVAGSQQRFVELMNTTAGILGLRDTHFANPHGLDAPGHYSTARDLARLAAHAMQYQTFAEVVGRRYHTVGPRPGLPRLDLVNLNLPLFYYPGVTGVKPGWTGRAGVTQVVSVDLDGRSVIAVLLNTDPAAADMTRLLDWIYDTRSFPVSGEYARSTVRGTTADGEPWTYYAATQQRVRAGFLHFYESVGGPDVLGYPITEEFGEHGRTVQYFQRARLEWHPELAGTPYEVQISLLGERLAAARALLSQPLVEPFQSSAWHRYFPGTGHSVHSGFLRYFDRMGGLDVLGYPITEELRSDVDWPYAVQYFQRGRLQYHPDRAGTRYEVTASLLGQWAWQTGAADDLAVPAVPADDTIAQAPAPPALAIAAPAEATSGASVAPVSTVPALAPAPTPTERMLFVATNPSPVPGPEAAARAAGGGLPRSLLAALHELLRRVL